MFDFLALEKWTLICIPWSGGMSVKWLGPGQRSDAKRAERNLAPTSWARYEAAPLSKARKMGFSDEELGV